MSMFSSAKDIMKWLSDCASAIAGQDKSVHWVTPLGLPIIQPYRCIIVDNRSGNHPCSLHLQSACTNLTFLTGSG